MPAIFDRVLTVNLVANTAIFYVAARLYLLPLVPRVRPQQILVPILLLHSTRHLGLMFLTRGATFPGMPPQFAYPAAFGDLITAILAFAAIPFVLRRSRLGKPDVALANGRLLPSPVLQWCSPTGTRSQCVLQPRNWPPKVTKHSLSIPT